MDGDHDADETLLLEDNLLNLPQTVSELSVMEYRTGEAPPPILNGSPFEQYCTYREFEAEPNQPGPDRAGALLRMMHTGFSEEGRSFLGRLIPVSTQSLYASFDATPDKFADLIDIILKRKSQTTCNAPWLTTCQAS